MSVIFCQFTKIQPFPSIFLFYFLFIFNNPSNCLYLQILFTASTNRFFTEKTGKPWDGM